MLSISLSKYKVSCWYRANRGETPQAPVDILQFFTVNFLKTYELDYDMNKKRLLITIVHIKERYLTSIIQKGRNYHLFWEATEIY